MRIAALILGIIGGVFGLLNALLALGWGGLGRALGTQGANQVVGLGWMAFIFAFLGTVGAGITLAKPRLGALMLLIAAIGMSIPISGYAVVAGAMFLIAALLAFMGRSTGADTHVKSS
jgi:hypothetical protein